MHASNKPYKEVAPEVLQVNEFEVAYASSANSNVAPQPIFYPKSAEQFARAIAMDEAEYEDMRAHGFYAEGTPFPQQPQTASELQAEIDMIEQEEYLDETEYRTAMNRLWSALG